VEAPAWAPAAAPAPAPAPSARDVAPAKAAQAAELVARTRAEAEALAGLRKADGGGAPSPRRATRGAAPAVAPRASPRGERPGVYDLPPRPFAQGARAESEAAQRLDAVLGPLSRALPEPATARPSPRGSRARPPLG